jgi:hypothetical protein
MPAAQAWPTAHGPPTPQPHDPATQVGARVLRQSRFDWHRHAPVPMLQLPPKGALLQSFMFLQPLQTPFLHTGRAELHWSALTHSTQRWAAKLHSGRFAPQSRLELQPHPPATQTCPEIAPLQSLQEAPHELLWVSSTHAPALQQYPPAQSAPTVHCPARQLVASRHERCDGHSPLPIEGQPP